MNEKPAQFTQDQIDAYVLGTLDPATRQQIEAKREQDAALSAALALGQDMLQVAKVSGREALKAEMAAWDAAMPVLELQRPPENPSVIKPLWLVWGGIAVAAILSLFFLVRRPAPVDSAQLLAQHIQPYPNLIVVVARAQTQSTTSLDSVFIAYEQGRYAAALDLMERLDTTLPGYTLDFYRANALLMENKVDQAYSLFTQVAQIDTAPFHREAYWYQALLDIKQGRTAAGRTAMKEIAQTEKHPYRNDAALWVEALQ